MSESYRNGAFALGIVVGGGLALNLFLWLDHRARNYPKNNSETENDGDYSQIGQFWDGLLGTFVSPSDTLAQWIMAFFTIGATIVLILTLKVANQTNQAAVSASNAAIEANRMLRQTQRPWLAPSLELETRGRFLNDRESKFGWHPNWTVENLGQLPSNPSFLNFFVARYKGGWSHDRLEQIARELGGSPMNGFGDLPAILPQKSHQGSGTSSIEVIDISDLKGAAQEPGTLQACRFHKVW